MGQTQLATARVRGLPQFQRYPRPVLGQMPHFLHSSPPFSSSRGWDSVTKAPPLAGAKARLYFGLCKSQSSLKVAVVMPPARGQEYNIYKSLCLCCWSTLAPLAIKIHPNICTDSGILFPCPMSTTIYSFTPDFLPVCLFPFF